MTQAPAPTVTAVPATLRPHEILQTCKIVSDVPAVSVALEGSNLNQFSLYDCGGADLFVIVSEKELVRVCSIEFILGDAEGFKITPASSKAVIEAHYLPGSSGESSAWNVEVSQKGGDLSAVSADGGNPKVQCEAAP